MKRRNSLGWELALYSPLLASKLACALARSALRAASKFSFFLSYALSAKPLLAQQYENVIAHSPTRLTLLIALRNMDESSSDRPLERKVIPGTVAGTYLLGACTVRRATLSCEDFASQLTPATVIVG